MRLAGNHGRIGVRRTAVTTTSSRPEETQMQRRVDAVVLDVGGVLEIVDDAVFPGPWCARWGIAEADLRAALGGLPGDPMIGGIQEDDVWAHVAGALGLGEAARAALVDDFWLWYVGTLDETLAAWVRSLRERGVRTALLSNSSPGAREHDACWGLTEMVELAVYSHEVGLAKPDPRILRLTTDLLGVAPERTLLVDDVAANVEAARAAGWAAVLHRDAASTIAEVEPLLGSRP